MDSCLVQQGGAVSSTHWGVHSTAGVDWLLPAWGAITNNGAGRCMPPPHNAWQQLPHRLLLSVFMPDSDPCCAAGCPTAALLAAPLAAGL